MNTPVDSLVHGDETYQIIGACFEVYKDKGCGFLEQVYRECLEIELELRGIPFVAQMPLNLTYKERLLTQTYKPDLICFDKVIVELKAVSKIVRPVRVELSRQLKIKFFFLEPFVVFFISF